MMNGAAMNCRQDQVLHSLHRDSRGLQGAGYHLQMNNPCEQKFPAQHSKAIKSQSDHFVIDGSSQYLQSIPTTDISRPARIEVRDPRSQVRWAQTRKPIDLPVPQFEIDMNYVGNHPIGTEYSYSNQNHTNLDLDTRIDLLIKSKALAGMHPIFSELDESADDSFTRGPTFRGVASEKHRTPSPVDEFLLQENDDPDKPLSRPPSPFLSRAKYLFWFNKAIELKEQAKAQEQALLEKATKKLLFDNVTSLNPNRITSIKSNQVKKSSKENKPLLNGLLNEISKEMKEMMKQQFINDVLEDTISKTIESWWEKEQVNEEQQSLIGCQKLNFTLQEQGLNTSKEIFRSEVSEKILPELVTAASPKDSFPCDFKHEEPVHYKDNSFDTAKDIYHTNSHTKQTAVSLPSKNLSSTERISSILSNSTSTTMKINSLSGSENKSKEENVDIIWEDKEDSEANTKANNKIIKHHEIIDIQELLSNIENSQHNQSKIGISSKMSGNKEDVNADDSTIAEMSGNKEDVNADDSTIAEIKCQEEQSISEITNEKYPECNILSNVIENQNSTSDEYLSNNIPVLSDCDIHLTKHSNSNQSIITNNEQRLVHNSSQKHGIQQNVIETALPSECDEKEQTPVSIVLGSDEVGIVNEGESQDEQSATNTDITKEDDHTHETNLINSHAQSHEHP